jgi:crossover junction endonuclease MUS81
MTSECANPLLLAWVKEWLDAARERNSKGVTIYKKAYDSLKACPLPFQHPSEAQQLHGFGPKLCDRLTEKLNAYCKENGLPVPERQQKAKATNVDGQDDVQTTKKARRPKLYVPTYRSGPFAIILALSTLDENSSTGMTKTEIIELAQHDCDSSFTAPSDPTKFYTAWNSMKTLLTKDLVYEKGRPLRRYTLTEDGWEVAMRIKKTLKPSDELLQGPAPIDGKSHDDSDFLEIPSSPVSRGLSEPLADTQQSEIPNRALQKETIGNESSLPTFSPITLSQGSFTVELVLDVREVRAKTDRDYMSEELTKKGVKPIMRSLELGDALWVAKCNDPTMLSRNGAEGDEIVLDWIVERKRLDDLVGSIKDGRFQEQKFRLRKSGVRNVIYIIEEIALNSENLQKVGEMITSAIASTQVLNGYFVKRTEKMDDTILYLTRMTMLLKTLYEPRPLNIIPTRVLTTQNYIPLLERLKNEQPSMNYNITYTAFASLASKSETLALRDVYLKMLMCTRGVTGEKALEIQRRWKTPQHFIRAFDSCGLGEEGKKRKRELVMENMGHLVGRKKIAKALSQKIAEVWSDA